MTNSFLQSIDNIPEQGSVEWLQERMGRFTSSRFPDLMTSARSKSEIFGGTAMSYIYEIAIERLTGNPTGFTGNHATEWGNENEPNAIAYYEKELGVKVDACGFLPMGDNTGGSPDGLVGREGIIEVKCPYNSAIHLGYLMDGVVPKKYYDQIQGNLMVTSRKWCDFISYDPRLPKSHRLFVVRVERDEKRINEIRQRLQLAEIEVQKIINLSNQENGK